MIFYCRRNNSGVDDGGGGGGGGYDDDIDGDEVMGEGESPRHRFYGKTYTDGPDKAESYLPNDPENMAFVGLPHAHGGKSHPDQESRVRGDMQHRFDREYDTEVRTKERDGFARALPPRTTTTTYRTYYFSSSINVVGDVACVVSALLPIGSGEPEVYVFRRRNGEWTQFRG